MPSYKHQHDAELFKIKLTRMSDVDIAWFAGWLSADGSIGVVGKNKVPRISLAICDRDPLERCVELFGGKVQGPFKPRTTTRRSMYQWIIVSMKARFLLERCMPWLSLRYRERAIPALQYKHYNKITLSDIEIIRRLLAEGVQGVTLAKRYGVFESTITRIKQGKMSHTPIALLTSDLLTNLHPDELYWLQKTNEMTSDGESTCSTLEMES